MNTQSTIELTITTASMIHTFSRQENKTREEALELADLLSNKSQREAEKILIEKAPEKLKRERIKVKTKNISELRVNITQECKQNIKKLKAYSAHRNLSLGELIGELIQQAVEKIEQDKFGKSHGAKHRQKKTIRKDNEVTVKTKSAKNPTPPPALGEKKTWKHEHTSKRAAIPKAILRRVWQRAGESCEFVSEVDQHHCRSKYFLQVDHRKPLSRSGTNEEKNLRLLCGKHNRWVYEAHKM